MTITAPAPQQTITLADVLGFISSATQDDLQVLGPVFNDRAKALTKVRRALAAAAVSVGQQVRIGDIKPKYLSGFTGELVAINGDRGTVRLSAADANMLGIVSNKYYFLVGTKQPYDLSGVPLSCLVAR